MKNVAQPIAEMDKSVKVPATTVFTCVRKAILCTGMTEVLFSLKVIPISGLNFSMILSIHKIVYFPRKLQILVEFYEL